MLHDFLNDIRFDLRKYFSWAFKSSKVVLWFGVMLLVGGCQEFDISFQKKSKSGVEEEPMVMVIKNHADDYSKELANQITKALDYTKIPYSTIDLGIISPDFSIPKSLKSIVITTDRAQQLTNNDIEKLVKFTARGNSIVVVGPISSHRFSYLQGLKPESEFDIDSTSIGFVLQEAAFPGMEGKTFKPKGLEAHYGLLKKDFKNGVKVLATTASNTEQAFITANKVGIGEVVLLNSFSLDQKDFRGIMFSAILRGLKGIPYEVANVSTLFLDDFPAPLYNQEMAPIDEEYGITHAEFVSKVWWSDMKELADRFDVDYSAMTAFNYNANVTPPFDFNEWQHGLVAFNNDRVQGSIYLAQDIVETRHELAFHGYNHFSLWDKDWDDLNFMISSLQAARKRWRIDGLGNLPTNYVPPTNQVDSLGLQAIIQGMPSIKFMSSLYYGDKEEGQGREFGPDPYALSDLYDYPRITSGFTMKESSLFDQQGLQLLTGIWTHFIHPDDVFQISQREEDDFESRNPLGLGWKSNNEHDYGLYHLLEDRLTFTKQQYPITRFVTATEGGKRAEDWRRRLSTYTENNTSLKVSTDFRDNYTPNFSDSSTYWFMYTAEKHSPEVEKALEAQDVQYKRVALWEGHLYQFVTDKNIFFVPNLDPKYYFEDHTLNALAQAELDNHRQHIFFSDLFLDQWVDDRFEKALWALRKDPSSIAKQEKVIELSIEFSQVGTAIKVLENRMLTSEKWNQDDLDRLITYYGWEGMRLRAEEFLELLWDKYASRRVIAMKDLAVSELGLYGDEFDKRWRLREISLNPDNYELLLSYSKSIESQDNWPEVKHNLFRLMELKPQTDSLYAFTIQRSLYYDPPEVTLNLAEQLSKHSITQLMPFATNLAYLYAFNENNLEKALFWAQNAPNFDEKMELYWLSQLNLDELYAAKAKSMILENPDDDSLRSYVGTNLFYQGFEEQAYTVMYPLFTQQREENLGADTLMENEIGYLNYEQQKDFYQSYPSFFTPKQEQQLQADYRRTEGFKTSAFGEYKDDNFNNRFIRGGISGEFGNRGANSHTIKTEYLNFSDTGTQNLSALTYQGLGYEFAHRRSETGFQLQAGASLLVGKDDFVPEGNIGVSFSKDSAFTSIALSGGSELTSTAIKKDYYQAQLSLYRQDYWFENKWLSTAASGSAKYYTNDVFRYEVQLRAYLELMQSKFRLRPLADASFSDATRSFSGGLPYYTPDKYFSKGAGIDLEYRNPDSFDYKTRFTAELLARHERKDGIYLSGRAEFQHQFDNFWEISLGSDFSTSKVYRSNRIFFSISYYFPKKLNHKK